MAQCVLRLRVEERSPIWRVAANILTKQYRTAERNGSLVWDLVEMLTSPYLKKSPCYETFTIASGLD